MRSAKYRKLLFPLWCLAAVIIGGRVDAANAGLSIDPFDQAAAQNSRLKSDLPWFFGGKSQRGWQIYQPLISNLVGVSPETGGEEFARAIYRWQQSSGIRPSGILDHETWMNMVATFQSSRIKGRVLPTQENLIQAPPGEFYDPSRPAQLRMVEREAYSAYKRMVAAARAELSLNLTDGSGSGEKFSSRYLSIISAFRSPEYQAQLRQRSPNSGRAGLAVNSPHFTGRALDLYVGGEPVSTADNNRQIQINTPIYQWLVRNAGRFGFRPYFYEPWHWEYRP